MTHWSSHHTSNHAIANGWQLWLQTFHEIPPSTRSDAPSRQPSLILFSLDGMPPLVEFGPTAVALSLAIGAGLLWSRTKRVSTLLQFAASVILFSGIVLEQIRWLYVLPTDQSVFANAMRSEAMHITIASAQLIGMVAFLSSYLWFALTQKRI